MMNTILNIGLNDVVVEGLTKLTGNARFAWDSYRRLIEMFGETVFNLDDEVFEHPMSEYKEKKGYKLDTEMTAEDWKELVSIFKDVFKKNLGFEFSQDVYKQLELATKAVFESWNGKRAIAYRRKEGISDDLGTAVNIVTMVFGNMGDDSGTGVAFTRNPSTGEKKMMGEYLLNAQGEDVVAGIRNADSIENLSQKMPKAYKQFMDITNKLEKHYKDMQDVEFTIERSKLWMLQTRSGKRTAKSAVKIAVDMANEGLITKEQAVLRVTPDNVDALLHPQFNETAMADAEKDGTFFAKGVNASPGAAVGQVYFDADTVEKMAKEEKQDTIMVRPFTKPDDVHGMIASKGVLTSEGGATSHAAVVARQFGIPCVVGASAIAQWRLMEKLSKKVIGFPSTARPGRFSLEKCQPPPPRSKSRPNCSPCFNGRMISAPARMSVKHPLRDIPLVVCRFGQMQIIRRMLSAPAPMARSALVFAAPSICSLNQSVFPLSNG
jgi:pyruvate,orthophosphate dikinase